MYYSNSNPKRITKKRFFKVGNIHHILQNQHYPMTRVFLLRWKSHIFATFKITGGQSLVLLENAATLQHSFTMPPLPAPPSPCSPWACLLFGPRVPVAALVWETRYSSQALLQGESCCFFHSSSPWNNREIRDFFLNSNGHIKAQLAKQV